MPQLEQMALALERHGAIRLHFTDTDSTALLRRTASGAYQPEGFPYAFAHAAVCVRVAVHQAGGPVWIDGYSLVNPPPSPLSSKERGLGGGVGDCRGRENTNSPMKGSYEVPRDTMNGQRRRTAMNRVLAVCVVCIVLMSLGIGGHVFGQHAIPFPHVVSPPAPVPSAPVGGIAWGLIYGITQAPQYAVPDTRVWEDRKSFRMQIRSWALLVFPAKYASTPSASLPGFCTPQQALLHARRWYPDRYSMLSPSPSPCFRADGTGAWSH